MLYRVLKDLSFGESIMRRGGLLRADQLRAGSAEKLLRVGAIAEVAAPPLAILPGWQTRAKRLKAAGIEDAAAFLDADDDTLARALRADGGRIAAWRAEVAGWLSAPPADGSGGSRREG